MQDAEYHGHEQQRGDGGKDQTADHGPAQGRGMLDAFAQAQRQADWLEDFLQKLLGRPIDVQPILTFPGWMIMRRGAGAVAVLNPKEIPAAIIQRAAPAPVLSTADIDLIARQLDARCRDVEY